MRAIRGLSLVLGVCASACGSSKPAPNVAPVSGATQAPTPRPAYAEADAAYYRARAIIERALKAQPTSGVSHEDLLAIGAGVGLSRAALESAAQEVTEARLTQTATGRIVSRRRRWVIAHAFVYASVNGILFAINSLTTPGQWWALFPIVVWGLAMILHAGFGLFLRVSDDQLSQEKRRLLKAAGAGVNQLLERQKGVRISESAAKPDRGDAASGEETENPSNRRSTQEP